MPLPRLAAQLADRRALTGWLDDFQSPEEVSVSMVGGIAASNGCVASLIPPRSGDDVTPGGLVRNIGRLQREGQPRGSGVRAAVPVGDDRDRLKVVIRCRRITHAATLILAPSSFNAVFTDAWWLPAARAACTWQSSRGTVEDRQPQWPRHTESAVYRSCWRIGAIRAPGSMRAIPRTGGSSGSRSRRLRAWPGRCRRSRGRRASPRAIRRCRRGC